MLVEVNGGGEYRVCRYPADRKRIDIGDYYADDRKFRQLTGWTAKVDLAEGLRTSIDYYRRHMRHYL